MSLMCYIKAIPFYLRTGEFIPHVYVEDEPYIGNIAYTDNSYREVEGLGHTADEQLAIGVYIYRGVCKHCGKVDFSWSRWKE